MLSSLHSNRRFRHRSLRLEALELRANPATFTVTATTDVVNPADDATAFTLREAITAANENPGADTIQFAPALKNQTIVVDHSDYMPWYGPTAFPPIVGQLSIIGNGVRIARNSSSPPFRFLYVAGGAVAHPEAGNLLLFDLDFSGGSARGGDGANGGGGAAGMGGAIYNQGTLLLSGVTLEANQAFGGNGAVYTGGDGGGGGLSGNGTAGGFGGQGNPDFFSGYGGSFGEDGTFGGGGGSATPVEGFKGGQGGFGGGSGAGGQGNPAFGSGDSSLTQGGGGAGLGGAIFNHGGTVTVINSTLTANVATGGSGAAAGQGLGGAIFNLNGTVTLTNATLVANRATQGHQIWSLGSSDKSNNGFDDTDPVLATAASITINNSILWQNTAITPDFTRGTQGTGTSTSAGVGNLIGIPGNFSGTVISSANPRLGSLMANGGFTRTLKPQTGSPVINAGVNAALPNNAVNDQRGTGFPRINDTSVDLGAVEFGEPNDVTGDGVVDVLDILQQIYYFNIYASLGPVNVADLPVAARISDVTRNGVFDISDILQVVFRFGLTAGNGEGEGEGVDALEAPPTSPVTSPLDVAAADAILAAELTFDFQPELTTRRRRS